MQNLMQKMYLLLPIGGLYRYRKSGEDHQYQGKLIHLLQSAVGSGSYDQYKKYSAGIHNLPPINIRDLLEFKKSNKYQIILMMLSHLIRKYFKEIWKWKYVTWSFIS